MRRSILLIIGLAVIQASSVEAKTFTGAPIAPDLGLDALTRSVARERVGRDVFSNPWATVTISNVDVYDRFPYVESRHFQIVSDPKWNRLVFGETGRQLSAFDGKSATLGALCEPRGMTVDEENRVYVADAGNDRIVVLQASTEFDRMTLTPLYAIGGLSHPYDVAYSDGGTPFKSGDDVLYVADTGKNRLVGFELAATSARKVAEVGDLGSGVGRFAGPMAVTVGRGAGANTPDVYVADAHNRRVVHLRFEGGGFRWVGDTHTEADVLTSLDADQWGNLYAAAPHQGMVQKFSPALAPVAELKGDLSGPKSFHVPFFTVHDHRDGSVTRVGQPNGLSVERWSDGSGMRMWKLGVAVEGLTVMGGGAPAVRFGLTDAATVTLEVLDAVDGHVLGRRAMGALEAGDHSLPLSEMETLASSSGQDVVLKVSAASSYGNGTFDVAQTSFRIKGGTVSAPSQPMLLSNWPNPMEGATRLAFVLPEHPSGPVTFAVFDALGRKVRTFGSSFPPGRTEISWDGTDDHGQRVRPGLYVYRLGVGDVGFSRRMIVVR